jgi:hypothetical protein
VTPLHFKVTLPNSADAKPKMTADETADATIEATVQQQTQKNTAEVISLATAGGTQQQHLKSIPGNYVSPCRNCSATGYVPVFS